MLGTSVIGGLDVICAASSPDAIISMQTVKKKIRMIRIPIIITGCGVRLPFPKKARYNSLITNDILRHLLIVKD